MKLINKIKCFFKGHIKHSSDPAAISLAWGHSKNQVVVNVDWCVRCATLFGWEPEPTVIIDSIQILPNIRTPSYDNGIPKLSDLIKQEKYNIPSHFDMDFMINNVIVNLKVKRATQEENSDLGENEFNVKNAQGKISKWSVRDWKQANDTYNDICHMLGAIPDPTEITIRDPLFDQLDFFRPKSIGKVGYYTNPSKSHYISSPATWTFTDVTFKVEPADENTNASGTISGQEKPS